MRTFCLPLTSGVRSYSVADAAGTKPSDAQRSASVSSTLQDVENTPVGFRGILKALHNRADRFGTWVREMLDSIRNAKPSSAQRETGNVRLVSMSNIGNDCASRESSRDISFASSNDISRTARQDTFSADPDAWAYRPRSDADESAILTHRSYSNAASEFVDGDLSARIIQSGLECLRAKYPCAPAAELFIPRGDTELRETLGAFGLLLKMGDALDRDDGRRSTDLEQQAHSMLKDAVERVVDKVAPDITRQYEKNGIWYFDNQACEELALALQDAKEAATGYLIWASVPRLMEQLFDVHRWGQPPLVLLEAPIPPHDAESDAALDSAHRERFAALVDDVDRCNINVIDAVLQWVKGPKPRMQAREGEPFVAAPPAMTTFVGSGRNFRSV